MNRMYECFLRKYAWLLDIYAIDYYVSDNWSKVPIAWRNALCALESTDWVKILTADSELGMQLPDDFIQFMRDAKELSLNRDHTNSLTELASSLGLKEIPEDCVPAISNNNILRYKIKRKKQHEIEQIIAVLRLLHESSSYEAVLDIGAGLGHLSRMVACFFPHLTIGTVEGNQNLVETASTLDDVFRRKLGDSFAAPQRKIQFIRAEDESSDAITLEKTENSRKQLLLGLHACGDLSSLIIKSFVAEEDVSALVLFSCCFHKINGGLDNIYHQEYSERSEASKGFPLSQEYGQIKVSYTARELACHAKEQLVEELLAKPDYPFSQRCYRALLEYALQKVGAEAHGHVKSVKMSPELSFNTFLSKGLANNTDLRAKVEQEILETNEFNDLLSNMPSDGKKIFIINCLRTLIAPVVEALIIKDRIRYIEESGFTAYAYPIFDPLLSPRNIVIATYEMVQQIIEKVEVDFPFEPYECQKAYMQKVIQALNLKCDAALESPTGTGKTLSLLCSTLAWVQQQKSTVAPTLQQVIAMANEIPGGPSKTSLAPKIYYSSRTHSQLTQVVRELNKTVYKNVPTSILASRDLLCVNNVVKKEKDSQLRSVMCRSLVQKHACYYYNQLDKCDSTTLQGMYGESGEVLDIEDLVTTAKKHNHCPFYRARQMTESAELILLPYNYLISPELRRRYDVDLKGSIVIFDEAHNLESICEESTSIEFSTTDIALAARELKRAIEILQEKTEETRTELDLGNQAFSSGVIEATKAANEPVFEIGVACRVFEMLGCLEKVIFDSYETDKTCQTFKQFEGKVYKGSFLLELFQTAEFGYDKAGEICHLLAKASDLLTETGEAEGSSFRERGTYLQRLSTVISTIYCSQSQQMVEASTEDNKVKYSSAEKVFDKFKLFLQKVVKDGEDTKIKISYWCFSASLSMKLLKAQGARSIIVTSGTLSPLQHFMSNIGLDFGCQLENVHAAQSNQVLTGVIKRGPGQTHFLNGNFEQRTSEDYHIGIGETLLRVAAEVPQGVLVFFSSYGLMNQVLKMLQSLGEFDDNSYYKRIDAKKKILVEPRTRDELDKLRLTFDELVSHGPGAFLFGVCRGKISEGIDFADASSRAVVIIGIPYPPLFEPRVILKKCFLAEQRAKDPKAPHPDMWYQTEGFRAVNQAIGRVLRHANDFGSVILLDCRFATCDRTYFPAWLRPGFRTYEKFEDFDKRLRSFFGERHVEVQKSQSTLLSKLIQPLKKKATRKTIRVQEDDQKLTFDEPSEELTKYTSLQPTPSGPTSLENLDDYEPGHSERNLNNKKKDLVPTTFGSVSLSASAVPSVPPRKRFKLLKKTAFLQQTKNNDVSDCACDCDNSDDARKEQEPSLERPAKQLKLTNEPKSAISESSVGIQKENMNTSVLSSMIAKRKMKTVTEAAAKNPENPNESSVQYVLPPDVPQCYRAAWDLGREQFSALLKETNLSREVTRLLYGLRDPEKFDVNFQKAKELLIPSHPKIFIAVAKYLKPKYKKVMVDYMCSTKLTF